MATFDTIRLPEQALIDDCVHCGFCLPTCPTYNLWGEEMDSPRGRIVLMSEALEGELSAPMVQHWDRCLGCMACVTACPSGVKYDKLIEDTRAQVERNHRRSFGDRLYRGLLFQLFPHPSRLRALAPLIALSRRLGISRAARHGGPLPRLRALAALAPPTPLRKTRARLPELTPARGELRGRVGLLQGCVQRVFFNDVNAATVAVLSAEGFEVHAPQLPRCCGALQLHTGVDSSELVKATIQAFEQFDHVVANAAGCGSSMKDYAHVLRDDPDWAERARVFSAKVLDVTELLAAHEPRAERHPIAPTRSPTTTPVTWPTRRPCARSRASCSRRSRGSSCWSPTAGRSAAARRASTTCWSPRPRASWGAARWRTCWPRARRRSRRATPAARSRSPPRATRWDGRCASTTRSS